ncbi:Acetyl-coenzyme A carboxylase carboxyl transferase subunit alpha [bioreactor metagenome]|uniref:acetyl-CoA carboxytransferase n=1 Tax=bioreactor metagenome TaxID=1076179 RepID=A0A645JGE2_9ZZZZ
MLENAVYSVISPEGCASILWKDAARAPEAAECLRITAPDLLRLGVIERIIREEEGMFASLSEQIAGFFRGQTLLSGEALASARYGRFRKMGEASL